MYLANVETTFNDEIHLPSTSNRQPGDKLEEDTNLITN